MSDPIQLPAPAKPPDYFELRAATGRLRVATGRLLVLARGVGAAVVAALLKVGIAELVVAGLLGIMIGAMGLYSTRRPQFAAGYEAVAAMVAAYAIEAVGT